MTWDWLTFFIGAPVWGSIGVALYAGLLAAGDRVAPRQHTRDLARSAKPRLAHSERPALSRKDARRWKFADTKGVRVTEEQWAVLKVETGPSHTPTRTLRSRQSELRGGSSTRPVPRSV